MPWHPEERRVSIWHRTASENMTRKIPGPVILHAELILTKPERNMLPGIFGSSHFNEEPVIVSIVKTSDFTGSINNLRIWIKLQVQDKLVSSKYSASLSHPGRVRGNTSHPAC